VKQQYGRAIALTSTTVTGTVQLKLPAPVGGLAVDIRNKPVWNSTAYAPPYVVVPAGATGATFPIGVSADREPRSRSSRRAVTASGRRVLDRSQADQAAPMTERAMTVRWISLVPSPISRILASE